MTAKKYKRKMVISEILSEGNGGVMVFVNFVIQIWEKQYREKYGIKIVCPELLQKSGWRSRDTS